MTVSGTVLEAIRARSISRLRFCTHLAPLISRGTIVYSSQASLSLPSSFLATESVLPFRRGHHGENRPICVQLLLANNS